MPSFKETQQAFVQHIKNPKAHPDVSGIEDRRLKIYRELFFNNILGFLSAGFPVLTSLYSEQQWRNLARRFFSEHACRSPYFIDISKEFVEYLSNEYAVSTEDPIFIKELAHYEWLELDVSVRHSKQTIPLWDGQSPLKQVQMSDLATLVSYHYPVHQICADYQPTSASTEAIYLVVYRDATDEVNFSLVNSVSAFMLNTISQHGTISISQLVELIGQAMPQLTVAQLNDSLQQVVKELLGLQILLPVGD